MADTPTKEQVSPDKEPTQVLYNYSTQSPEALPESAINDALASGQYAFDKEAEVPVMSPSGEYGTVKGWEAFDALKNGFSYIPHSEMAKKAEAEKYGEQNLKAAAVAAARGASLGLSDVALEKTGLVPREEQKKLEEYNPDISTLAEMGGMAAGTLIPGAPVGLASKAGELVTKATAKSLGGTVAAKAAGSLAGSTVEGAFWTGGKKITEDALGEPSATAEEMLLETGAMGLLGFGMHATGGLVKGGMSKAKDWMVDPASSSLAAKTTEKLLPAIKAAYGEEAAALTGKILNENQGVRAELFNKNFSVADLDTKLANASKEAEKVQYDTAKRVKAELNVLDAEEQKNIKALMEQTGGDLYAARDLASNQKSIIGDQLQAELAKAVEPPSGALNQVLDRFDELKESLSKHAPKELDAIDSYLENALEVTRFKNPETGVRPLEYAVRNQGEEAQALLGMRRAIDDQIPYSASGKPRVTGENRTWINDLVNLRADVDNLLKNSENPTIAGAFRQHDPAFQSIYKSERILNQIAKDPVGGEDASILKAIKSLNNDVKTAKATEAMDALSSVIPQAKETWGKLKTLTEKTKFVNDLQKELGLVARTSADRMEFTSNMVNILDSMKIETATSDKLRRIVEASRESAMNPEMTPIDRYMRIMSAAGHPIDKVFEAYSGLSAKAKESAQDLLRLRELTKGVKNPLGSAQKSYGKAWGMGLATGLAQAGHPIIGGGYAALNIAKEAISSPFDTIQRIATIERAKNKGIQALNSAVQKIVSTATSPSARSMALGMKSSSMDKKDREKRYDKLNAAFSQVDPQQAKAVIEGSLKGFEDTPKLKEAVIAKNNEILTFLKDKFPILPENSPNSIMFGKPYKPSSSVMAEFERYFEAATNPKSVLENMQKGVVTTQEIEALSKLYPRLYSQLQQKVIEGIMQSGKPVSYEGRLKLGLLFDIPTDFSLDEQAIAGFQESYAHSNQETPQAPKRLSDSRMKDAAYLQPTETTTIAEG